jgi:hypothetical protein
VQRVSTTLLILATALCSLSPSSAYDKPVKAKTPLSADEIAIYTAVLQQFSSKESDGKLQVSITTYPLNPDSPMSGLTAPDCLKSIQLDNLAVVSHSSHDLPPDVLMGKRMTLVDPKK